MFNLDDDQDEIDAQIELMLAQEIIGEDEHDDYRKIIRWILLDTVNHDDIYNQAQLDLALSIIRTIIAWTPILTPENLTDFFSSTCLQVMLVQAHVLQNHPSSKFNGFHEGFIDFLARVFIEAYTP